ncbi:MAG: helix-turn-helix domain-containing protein [Thermoplasmata archaeon]
MLQVSLSLNFTCPWMDHLSEKYGGTIKLLQCVSRATGDGMSVLAKITGLDKRPDQISRAVSEIPSVQRAVFAAVRPGTFIGIVTTRSCPCLAPVLPHSNVVQATVTGKDRMRWTLLLDGGTSLRELTQDLKERGIDFRFEEVTKLRDVARLTERQEEVLQAALDLGFYDIPRRTGLRELAQLFGVSPRAVSEVLRRAHRRAVSHILRLPEHQEL